MLVYRTSRPPRETAALLRAFRDEAERLGKGAPGHGEIRDLLVAFDELESAVVDALNPEGDDEGAVEIAFRGAALALGEVFAASRDGRKDKVIEGVRRLTSLLGSLEQLDLPPSVLAAEAEGYAWYALYPEVYLAAARSFLREIRPRAAVCLGIRQIGSSLSAVVAAALAKGGCPVTLHTVRPRGHPFSRTFLPSPALEERLRSATESAVYLIVDEGPGLSGSSFCCIAETLSGWGVPDERIVFFPSWAPDGSAFVSPSARVRWRRHRPFTAGWGESWPGGSPLASHFPQGSFTDISAGGWRPLLLGDPADYPPVHPQHERCKFLLHGESVPLPRSPQEWGSPGAGRFTVARFAGLGRRGREALERARVLEEGGWGPPVVALREGFLLTRFVPGRPLSPDERPPLLLETLARYLAFVRERFPAADAAAPEDVREMVRVNVAEGLGDGWAKRLPPLLDLHLPSPPTALDGRLFPHEWLLTSRGLVKTDGIDHHDDHFFPGPTDIAWDLAAACIEFNLSAGEADTLLRHYATFSGDEEVVRRLLFHRMAYLAFRLGYTRMAADALGSSADGGRFSVAAERYYRLLREVIERAEGMVCG